MKDVKDLNFAAIVNDVVGFIKSVIEELSAFFAGFKKTYAFEKDDAAEGE